MAATQARDDLPGRLGPADAPTSLLETLDGALRAFVAAHPSVAVALIADIPEGSVHFVNPEAFCRCLHRVLAEVIEASPGLGLLLVKIGWEAPPAACAVLRIATMDPGAVVRAFCWGCEQGGPA